MEPGSRREQRQSVTRLWMLVLAATWLALAAGCMFAELKKEIQEEKISRGLHGRVEGIARTEGNVIVLLYTKTAGDLNLHRYNLADENGNYSFIATPGTYLVAGFDDRNNNLHHDPGEPAGAWGHPNEIVITGESESKAEREKLSWLNFELTQGSFPLANAAASIENSRHMSVSLLKMGERADWDDPTFDDEHGVTGFWKPMTFLKQHGAGIYFMAPFDSEKIPVLFIHGAVGTPRGWKPLADSLDSRRFQPWVAYYPTGLRLDQISEALNEMIKRLQLDYGFERMAVVAHSMGGLVSRSFILKHLIDDGMGTVKVFVSISSPWGGVLMAAKGVEQAPEAIPSWHDVAPNSDFIRRIFADPLNPQVPHYLIFGYRGDCSLFMANNDGTLEVSSQLDLRAQDDAVAVLGLNESHMSILTSEKTMAYMNQALEAALPVLK